MEEKLVYNSDNIPTKELLRTQRKRDYELAKKVAKAKRKASKESARQKKLDARDAKDKALWNALKPASQIESED